MIPIETETRQVEANGWVQGGAHHSAMFCHPQPAGVKGCPLGRSQVSVQDAIRDLAARTNQESGTNYNGGDLMVTRHNGQPVPPPRVLVLRKDPAGQFQYQTTENCQPLIDWQYGGFDRDATIAQARDRFSFDHVAAESIGQSGFQTPTAPSGALTATPSSPVTIYYCKAGVRTGQTVRVSQGKSVTACSGVRLEAASGTMLHGNSTGKAKASGARCVLELVSGTITTIP